MKLYSFKIKCYPYTVFRNILLIESNTFSAETNDISFLLTEKSEESSFFLVSLNNQLVRYTKRNVNTLLEKHYMLT